jgi:predicted nuclease of predicted toxin-antitoxin system
VRLLLDEMIPPRIARELRAAGYDVQAIKKDRPELSGSAALELVRLMAVEERTIVTNDVGDFQAIHDRLIAAGDHHHGMIFTFDATLPRTKDAISSSVRTLGATLDAHAAADALRDRVHHAP